MSTYFEYFEVAGGKQSERKVAEIEEIEGRGRGRQDMQHVSEKFTVGKNIPFEA
jgi:hypothetical protein